MRKILTLAAALLASFSLSIMADTKIYTFDDDVALATDWDVTTNVPSGGTATCEITTSINSFPQETGSTNYLGLGYLNKSNVGIDITTTDSYENISEISIDAIASDNSKPTIAAYIVTSEGDEEVFAAIGTKDGFDTGGSGKWGKKTVTLATPVSGQLKIVTIASSSGKYAALDNITITYTPTATDPVASVTIEGPTEAAVGFAAKYTATTDQTATEYKWFVDGAEQTGATKKTFEFTPAVKGATYAIVCKARNDNNATDEWIASTAINVTGTKLCGELIKATLTSGSAATVTGVIGGSATVALSSSKKLDNGKSFGITLASGSTFMQGDVVTINIATAASQGLVALYEDKEMTKPVYEGEDFGTAGDNTFTLPAAANGLSTLWIARKDGVNNWNPILNSISVTRSCEDSNDATIHSLTVNGNEVAENDGVFEYTLSASYAEPTVTIAFEIHPLATIKYSLSNPYELTTPGVGESNGQAFTIIAEDGTEKTYTVLINKSTELSGDWHLKELSVAGYTLSPEFDTETFIYHISRAYEAANPAVSAITAVARQENATVEIQDYSGTEDPNFYIQVTAENGEENGYVIWIDVAPAVKKINEVILSNGYSAYIVEGQSVEPFVINGFYLAGQDAPTVSSYQVNDGTTWAIDGNDITLTGADNSIALYSLVLAEVAPVEFTADEIVFDGSESWVKSGYGWDATNSCWKFSKTDGDYSREIAGKTHVEMFLPACDTIVLKKKSSDDRDFRVYANGVAIGDTYKLVSGGVAIAVEQVAPFMLTIASAQTKGDGRIASIRMAKKVVPTAISNTEAEIKAVKFIENGQLFILKNGIKYNANGAIVK